MKKVKKNYILYVIMIILGLLIVGGGIFAGIIFINSSGDKKSSLEVLLNFKLSHLETLKEENNNKFVIVNGAITSTVTDPEFNVKVNGLGMKRVVRKWDGNYWILVDNKLNDSEKYYTETFYTNEIIINNDFTIDNFDFKSFSYLKPVYFYGSNFPYMDTKNIELPNGFSIRNDYNALLHYDLSDDMLEYYLLAYDVGHGISSSSFTYITNSTAENPKIGDIRIYFQPLSLKGANYICLLGRQVDKRIELYNSSYDLAKDQEEATLFSEYMILSILIYKIIFIVLCCLPFIGFLMLFFGITHLKIFEKKFGKIKKYKIFLTSLILGVIVPVVICLFL